MTLNAKSKIFFCLALMLIIFSGLIFQQYRSINDRLASTLILLDKVQTSAHQIEREILNETPDIALIKQVARKIPVDIAALQKALIPKYKPKMLVDLEITFVRLRRVVDKSLPGKTLEVPLMKQISHETIRIEQAVEGLQQLAYEKHDQLRTRAEVLIFTLYGTFFAFIFGMIVFLTRMIVRPIVMISNEIEELGEGTRDEISLLKRTDELGKLNEFIRNVIAELAEQNKTLQAEVNERKLAEEKLRQSSMTLENVLDNSNPICITNLDFEVLQANKAYYDIWPTEETEKQRQKCYDSRPGSLCHTDSCPLQQIKHGKEEAVVEAQKIEKSGKEDYFIITARAFRDEQGELLGIVESFQDITERIHMERKLQESETRFRQLAENIGEIFWMTSVDGKEVIYVSPAYEDIWGRSCESLYENPMSRFENIHPDSRETFLQSFHGSPKEGGFDVTYRITRPDAQERWIRDRGFPVLNEENEVYRIAGIAEDITVLKHTQDELQRAKENAEEASKAKSDFLANMSHEIRTPLNVIVGMYELLEESELNLEQKQYLKILALNSESLLCTINDIIDLSKVDAGRLEFEKMDLDLVALLEDTTEMLALKAHEKGLELYTVLDQDAPVKITGDLTRLRQILVNLIVNAIKFTSKGEITVKCELSKTFSAAEGEIELLFTVSDTGIGISEENLGSIFERFSQADTSTTREFGGTGLGLTISKMLCELMGGKMWVESKLGQGSTFYFTIRVPKMPGVDQTIGSMFEPIPDAKVLLVDGHSTSRTVLSDIIRGWNVAVDLADDGDAAMEYLKEVEQNQTPYDFALVDCQFPGMDGFQFAKYLREAHKGEIVTGLMLTADERRIRPERYREAGVNVCLTKPVNRAELYAFLSKMTSDGKVVTPVAAKAARELFLPDMSFVEPMTILLAEDFVHNRLVIEQFLKKTPFKLDIAENGAEAIEKFNTETYDLILMDIEMPIMDGYTATREIRKIEEEKGLARIPIIALSAYALKKEMDRSIEVGCDEHLTKPLKKAVLLKTLVKYAKAMSEKEHHAIDSSVSESKNSGPITESHDEQICLDQDFADFIPKFLDDVEGDIALMKDALVKRDYEFIRMTSHRIKGAGGGYGLDAVSNLAREIETASREGSEAVVEEQLNELTRYLQRIDIKYE